jgi:FkbM family methyltransferase
VRQHRLEKPPTNDARSWKVNSESSGLHTERPGGRIRYGDNEIDVRQGYSRQVQAIMKQDFRHWVRRFIPKGFYGNLRQMADRLAILRCEGPDTLKKLRPLDEAIISMDLRSLKHPFKLRRCASHVDGLVQNVFRREYDHWLGDLEPRVIVDAGAYIGDLTCHWATKFPEARIVALEPNPPSHEFTALNTDLYGPRITVLRAGLGATAGRCGLSGSEMSAHLVLSANSLEFPVEVTTIDAILANHNIEHIDLLKMDIEGSEAEVLANAASWIDKVKVLVVEFHGEAMERDGIAQLSAYGLDYRRYRSILTFARRF